MATAVIASGVEAEVADEPPAIPPGQEDVLLEMLGKGSALPAGCKLTDGKVEYTVVEATYDCGKGDVVVELAHSSWAVQSDVQTRHFALGVTKGAAPSSLVDALAVLILDREDSFEWSFPAEGPGALGQPAAE